MKLTFLGTAAATSFPLAFCNCETCVRARQMKGKNWRKRSSAIINGELLIDLSPDFCAAAAMYDVDPGRIKYLLQTHSHSDHFDAGHFITRWSEYAAWDLTPIEIVCSGGTARDMNHWICENEPSFNLFDGKWQRDMRYELKLIRSGERVQCGKYEITALDSGHDSRLEAMIYLISAGGKTILYGTDLIGIGEESWRILEGVRLDLVVLDQTYGAGFNNGGHLDARQVAEIVCEMRRKKIIGKDTPVYATHISHEGNGLHEEMEEAAQREGYHIAYDGLTLEI